MGVKVLSLFDGMSCGMLAMKKAELTVDEYTAYEIDKYAVQTAQANFPMIKECGDVFKADFTQYTGIDYLVGGSPCTYWSIAQKNNRETEASGLGWELFSQYVRAVKEAQPKFFIYENNKSMSSAIRESITKTFGFEPICINSALVSAQSRQRLYWVGRRNDDGTYSKVEVEQPTDKGILLKDILDAGVDLTSNAKAWTLTASYDGAVAWNTIERNQRNMVAEPVNMTADGKAQCLRASCYKDGIRNIVGNDVDRRTGVAEPVNTTADTLVGTYATPVEFDGQIPTKARSYANGKTYTVYEVKDGKITIKGKQYSVKLNDGYYIIRKLTVSECKRLQTVPEDYKFPVSNAQAYKMLGNGWTVDVIAHLIKATLSAPSATK